MRRTQRTALMSVTVAASLGAFCAQAAAACPAPLQNNTTADATQVMAWFDCKVPLIGPNFTGNVGIGDGTAYGPGLSLSSTLVSGANHATVFAGAPSGTNDSLTFNLSRGGGAYGDFNVNFSGTTRLQVTGNSLANGGNITFNPVTNTVFASGNVGIGTPSPFAVLDARSATGGFVLANTSSTADGQSAMLVLNPGGAFLNSTYWNKGPAVAGIFEGTSTVSGLAFYAYNGAQNERMRISANGNVGIGTANPSQKFVVVDNSTSLTANIYNGNANGLGLSVTAADSSNYSFRTEDYNGNERFRITGAGNVGIGTTSPGQKLDVAGSIRQSGCTTAGTLAVNSSGDIICSSDARLKNVHGPYGGGLAQVLGLRPVRFSYKPTRGNPVERFEHAGFLAQEVNSVIPQAVARQRDGYYSLETTAILAATVNAIKELKAINDKQTKEIQVLKNQVADLNRQRSLQTASN